MFEKALFSWVSPGGPALTKVAPLSRRADCSSTASCQKLGDLFKKKKKREGKIPASISINYWIVNLTSSRWRSVEIAQANWRVREAVLGLQTADESLLFRGGQSEGALLPGAATPIQVGLNQEGHLELCQKLPPLSPLTLTALLGGPYHLPSGRKLRLWEVEWPARGHVANRWLCWLFGLGVLNSWRQCAFLWLVNILHFSCHFLSVYTPAKSFQLIR